MRATYAVRDLIRGRWISFRMQRRAAENHARELNSIEPAIPDPRVRTDDAPLVNRYQALPVPKGARPRPIVLSLTFGL